MNILKNTAAGLGAAALALMLGTGASAQTAEFAAAGSSALFPTLRTAAQTVISTGNTYTENNVGFIVDPSLPNAPEQGNIFVVYTPTLPRRVAFDISVDSTVGDRAYFNSDTVRFTPTAANITAAGTAGGNGQIPQDVVDIVNRSIINVAATDIRPEDALVATATAFRLGYSPTNPIRDGGGNAAYPVTFSLASRNFTVNPIGASPVLIFANTTTTNSANPNVLGSGGALVPGAQNINRFTLGKIVDGTLFRTSDIDINATSGQPLTTFIREPLSGTYNTFEFCVPRSLEVNSTQEAGVNSNPLNEAGVPLSTAAGMSDTVTDGGASSVGGRVRAIGTGALIRGVNSTSNALGYAFFSIGSFAAAGNTRYLSVENAEPLNAVYTGGVYPTAGATVTFPNLIDGAYPIWSLLRLVFDQGNTVAPAYLTAALNANSGGNFAPANSLRVFRSHRAVNLNQRNSDGTTITANIRPNNGTAPGTAGPAAEAGADAGGAIFLINNDRNFSNDTGNQLTNFRQ